MLYVFDLLLVLDLIDQIWSIKAALEVDHFICDSKTLRYVILHLLSGRSCQSKDRNNRETLLQDVQVQIIFTEVLSPMRYAMYFIDDEAVNFAICIDLIERTDQTWTLDNLLRSEIDNFVFELSDFMVEGPNLFLFLLSVANR